MEDLTGKGQLKVSGAFVGFPLLSRMIRRSFVRSRRLKTSMEHWTAHQVRNDGRGESGPFGCTQDMLWLGGKERILGLPCDGLAAKMHAANMLVF